MTVPPTVIVCAYTSDRWDDLCAAMASIEDQGVSCRTILVIDNEEALLERARDRFTGAVVIPNAGPRGLSHARNTGIAAAEGEILVFLDDDASGEPGWLAALIAPFDDPDVIGVAGVARPLWPAAAPAVLPAELLWIVGCSFEGQERGRSVRNAMGCNMAFRADAVRAVGGFDPALGRVGRIPVGAEETDLCIRLRRVHPGRIAFADEAVVLHRVHPSRTTLRYVAARSFGEGISKAALSDRVGSGDALSRERAYATRILPLALLRELRRFTPAGFAAATSIGVSVASAAAGYARGRLRSILTSSVAAPARGPEASDLRVDALGAQR